MPDDWLDKVKWNAEGLVPAIAQDCKTGRILSLAWMNRQALHLTVKEGRAIYWSRSRQKIWRKGEQSGYEQSVKEIHLDCDQDAITMKVEQTGGIACHTGRISCFYYKLEQGEWIITESVLKDPVEIYAEQ